MSISSSSQQSSIHNGHNNGNGNNLRPSNLSFEHDHHQQQQQSIKLKHSPTSSSMNEQSSSMINELSPRIPRKSFATNDINNDSPNQLKPSSPSIMMTPKHYPSSNNNYMKKQPNDLIYPMTDYEPEVKYVANDDNTMDDDDDYSPKTKMIKTQSPPQRRNSIENPQQIDVSLYTTKKNVAQGMLDIALLSANCSQLKYLLYHYERDVSMRSNNNESAGAAINNNNNNADNSIWSSMFSSSSSVSLDFYFIINLSCICVSIFLQIILGILLIMNSRHNVYIHRYQRLADTYSNLILITVFIVTVVNIFLSVFISAH